MYHLLLTVALSLPPQSPIPPQAPAKVECGCSLGLHCTCGDSCPCSIYMDACKRAVRENKRLYCYVDKNVVVVPGVISGRFIGQFPGVKGPAIVIAEPDGKGWLEIVEIRYDRGNVSTLEAATPSMRLLTPSNVPTTTSGPLFAARPLSFGGFGGGRWASC